MRIFLRKSEDYLRRSGALTCIIPAFPYNFRFFGVFASKCEQKFQLRHYMPELMSKMGSLLLGL